MVTILIYKQEDEEKCKFTNVLKTMPGIHIDEELDVYGTMAMPAIDIQNPTLLSKNKLGNTPKEN